MGRPSRSEIATTIAKARNAILKRANLTPLSIRQEASLKEGSATGPWCVSHTSLPAPPHEERDPTDTLMRAIERLDQRPKQCTAPSAQNIKAEWLAYCEDGGPPETASQQAKYDWISDQTQSQPTIFYIQGGGFVLASPRLIRHFICSLPTQAEFAS